MRLIDAEKLKRRLIEGDGDDEFTEGYNCAINEIMGYIDNMPTIEAEHDNSWISVEDRLPALLEKVLTYGGNGKTLMNWLEELEDGDFYFTCGGKIITHWMPLPTPPESDDVADDDVVECDFNSQICESNVPWVDDDTLPNEDMIPDNEFIGDF